MLFSYFVFQMLTILRPIHQVCVWLRVLFSWWACPFTHCPLQKIKAAQCLPLVEKWEDFMLPSICGSFLLRRKSSWWEGGLPVHWIRWAVTTFAMNCKRLRENVWKSWRAPCYLLSQVDQTLGKGWAAFVSKLWLGGITMPFSFVRPASGWLDGVGLGP